MAQLTPEDFARMQREAKARVAEMQKRSRFFTERLQQENKPSPTDVAEDRQEKLPALQEEPVCSRQDPPTETLNLNHMRQEADDELLWLLCLSALVGPEDHELLFLLMTIIML